MAADGGQLVAPRAKDLLHFLTCGSVDDGKSTLVGRLLYDCSLIPDDQLATLRREWRRSGTAAGDLDFCLLLDGLEDERQQKITIDVAYRFFAAQDRAFAVADTPGHEHTQHGDRRLDLRPRRNPGRCAQGCAAADQTACLHHRAARYSPSGARGQQNGSLGFDEHCFEEIATQFAAFAASLGNPLVRVIPLSARLGDNVTTRSTHMPWYQGPTLLEHLRSIEVAGDERPFRLPVQWVNRPNGEFRGFSGTVVSGSIAPVDEVLVAGTGRAARVKEIVSFDGALACAAEGDAVTLTLDSEIDIASGDVLADPRDPPECVGQFAAHVIWFSEQPLVPSRSYLSKIGTRTGAGHRHRAQASDQCRDPGAVRGQDSGPQRDRVLQPVDRHAGRVRSL